MNECVPAAEKNCRRACWRRARVVHLHKTPEGWVAGPSALAESSRCDEYQPLRPEPDLFAEVSHAGIRQRSAVPLHLHSTLVKHASSPALSCFSLPLHPYVHTPVTRPTCQDGVELIAEIAADNLPVEWSAPWIDGRTRIATLSCDAGTCACAICPEPKTLNSEP